MNPFKKAKANVKRSISRKTGIPLTKGGRKRKSKKMEQNLIGWVIVIAIIVWLTSSNL